MKINLVLLFLVLAALSANVFAQNTMFNLRVLDIDPGTEVYAKANSSGQLITSAVASEDGANLSIPEEVIFYLETDPDEYYIPVNGNLKPIKEVKYVFHAGKICDAELSYCASFDYNFMGYPLSPYKQSDLKNTHSCFGPDPGAYDLFSKGSIIMYGGPYPKVAEDVCIDDNTVRKYWCENGYGKSIDLVCPEGHLCWGGLCFEGTHLVKCTDSDGYDFFKKGTVRVTNPDGDSYFEDRCDDESTLIEITCLGPNDIAHPEVITCPSGYSCSDGACVQEEGSTEPSGCFDPDGYNIYEKSTVTLAGKGYTDYCEADGKHIEMGCSNNLLSLTAQKCPDGYMCSDGACVQSQKPAPSFECSDTDGYDIYVRGIMTLEGYDYIDYCDSGGNIVEHECSNGGYTTTSGKCPTGYQCSDGACKVPDNQTHILIFSWLYQTDGSKDFHAKDGLHEGYAILEAKSDFKGFSFENMVVRLGSEDFYFLMGAENTPTLWANNGKGGLVDLGKSNIGDHPKAPDNGYVISGLPVVLGHVYAVKSQDGTHYGLIKPYMHEVRDITNGKSYCNDSEKGKNIYNKGFVTVGSLYGHSTQADMCIDQSTVGEHVCAGFAHSSPYLIDCPFGYVCSDGACIEKTGSGLSFSCSDSDGYDIFTKGNVEEVGGLSTQKKEDYCANAYRVVEYFCPTMTSKLSSKEIACGEGYYCSDGACISNIKTCNDTIGKQGIDGRNEAHVTNFGYSYIYGDFCMDDYLAKKFWCSGNELNSEYLICPQNTICKYGRCIKPTEGNYSNLTITLNPATYWKVINLKDVYGNNLKQGITPENGSVTFRISEGQAFYVHSSQGYSDLWKAKQGHNQEIFKFVNNSGIPILQSMGTGNGILIPFRHTMYLDIAQSISCIDYDGFDPYQSSYVQYQSNAMAQTQNFRDFCIDERTLIEQLCNDTSMSFKAFDCPIGYSCDSGACVQKESGPPPALPEDPTAEPSIALVGISIQPGWNMFSIPTTTENVISNCSGFSIDSVWMYNSFSGEYIHPASPSPGIGYWFHSTESCIIQSKGTSMSPAIIFLHKGWNLIGSAINSYSFDQIKGTCDFTNGPYSYDSSSQRYSLASTMMPGSAYFIKVDKSCSFSMEKNPPAPPEASTCSSTHYIGPWTMRATANCNGGGYECMESPGCPDKVQRCGDGICTPQSSCDVIHWDNGSACNCTQDIGPWTMRATTNCNN